MSCRSIAAAAALEQSVTRYFLTHYVTVCERFNFATAESDYEECGAFHSAQRNQAWYALWNPNNPASPLNVHKDGSSVRVQVESVSFFQRAAASTDLAQVRYVKAERTARQRRATSRTGSRRSSTPTPTPSQDPHDAPLESAGLQGRGIHRRTRGDR